jgi:hypothetical protein
VAVWIAPNIEHFHFDEPFAGGRPTTPDVPSYAVPDYGNRVAIWRMMRTFDRYGMRVSVCSVDLPVPVGCSYVSETRNAPPSRGSNWCTWLRMPFGTRHFAIASASSSAL